MTDKLTRELFPNHLRGKANALATSGNWAFNFALGYFVPPAFVSIKWKTYLVFAVFCVVMSEFPLSPLTDKPHLRTYILTSHTTAIHVFFMFPETAGKPLEEVTDMFEDPKGFRYIGTPAWRTKNYTSTAKKLERGEGLEKKVDEDSTEQVERVEGVKMDV